MSQSFSFKSSPWTSFSKQSDSLITDQFVQKQILTFKTSHLTKNGIIKFKQMISLNSGTYDKKEQIKVWFPIWNEGGSLFFRLSNDIIKFIYQHGFRSYSGRIFNLYGGAKSQRNFKNVIFKFGAEWIGTNTSLDSRLRISMNQKSQTELSLGQKYHYFNQNWTFDFCNIIDFHTASLFCNSLRIIRTFKDSQIFFKAHNNKLRTVQNVDFTDLDTYFTNFTFDYIQKLNKSTKAGVQVNFTKKSLTNSCLVLQHKIQSGYKFKGKLSTNRSLALTVQAPIRDYGRLTLGWEVKDLGNKNKNHAGLHLELNL